MVNTGEALYFCDDVKVKFACFLISDHCALVLHSAVINSSFCRAVPLALLAVEGERETGRLSFEVESRPPVVVIKLFVLRLRFDSGDRFLKSRLSEIPLVVKNCDTDVQD